MAQNIIDRAGATGFMPDGERSFFLRARGGRRER